MAERDDETSDDESVDEETNEETSEEEESSDEESSGEPSDDDNSDDDDSDDDDPDDDDSDDDSSDDDDSDDDDSDDDDSDDDSSDDEDEPPKKKVAKKTAKKKTAKKKTAKKKTAKKKRRTDSPSGKKKSTRKGGDTKRAKGPAPAPDEEEDTTRLIIGAVIVAALAVAFFWWLNNRDSSSDPETTRLEPAAESANEEEVVDLPTKLGAPPGARPGAPPGAPPRPTPIPAPDDVAAAPENAERTESGLASRVLEAGTGSDHPGGRDRVTVQYTGWTTDGQMFDSSRTRGRPATFGLDGVIAGWTEGVQLMVVGEQRRFWIPQDLAYGGRPGAPQGMLVFDIELVSFEATPPPIPAPDDVAAAPRNAERTESGLASRVLEAGTGTEHPTAQSRVSVNYTGWTTDGEMFDSSLTRGRPATFPLGRVIPGWTEGMQLMVVGERRRFWIPESLAYAGRPGAPQGMLVFDVELLEIN